jgi:uncharacterized protein YukE
MIGGAQTALQVPGRPGGDGEAVKAGRYRWYELAGESRGTFAELQQVIAGTRWSGDARMAFDASWSQFSGHATEASQHAHEVGDWLLRIGNQIEDAQHRWDVAMSALASMTGGIGTALVSTLGAVAGQEVTAAVGVVEDACSALEHSLAGAVQALADAVRTGTELAVKLTWQIGAGLSAAEDVADRAVVLGARAVTRTDDMGRTALHYLLDVVAVPPYALYYFSYEGAYGINQLGSGFGTPGRVVSHIVAAPLVVPQVLGLGGDAGIDWVKGHTVNNESVRDEGQFGGILPRFILGGGPKTWLPGLHPDGTVDLEW